MRQRRSHITIMMRQRRRHTIIMRQQKGHITIIMMQQQMVHITIMRQRRGRMTIIMRQQMGTITITLRRRTSQTRSRYQPMCVTATTAHSARGRISPTSSMVLPRTKTVVISASPPCTVRHGRGTSSFATVICFPLAHRFPTRITILAIIPHPTTLRRRNSHIIM